MGTYKNNLPLTIICFVLIVFLMADTTYAQSKRKKRKKRDKSAITKPTTKLSSEDRLRLEKYFFEGINAKLKDDMPKATEAFKNCIKIDQYHDAAMYELAKIYFDKKDKEAALNYAKSAATTDENNKWYQFLYAEILAINDMYEDAADVYKKLVSKYPEHYDYYFDWGYMLIQANKYQEAVDMYNNLEQKIGVTENVSVQKQRLYIQLEEPEKAIAELEKLVEYEPNNIKHYRTLTLLYKENGMEEKAAAINKKMVDAAPDNPYGRISLAEHYRESGQMGEAFDELKKAFKNPELSIEMKVRSLTPFISKIDDTKKDDKTKQQVFELAKVIVETHPKDALAQALYGDLLYADKRPKEALAQFEKAAAIDGSKFEVWRHILLIKYDLKDYKSLVKSTDQVISLFPNQALPYYLKGLANNELNEPEKAIKALKRARLISARDKDMQAQVYALMGEIYNKMEKYVDSDKSYEKALAIHPDDPLLLNNYSYFMSLRKGQNDLAKAAKMSKKSNDMVPNNASFQDTYGWILYQQQKYNDAKTWLEKSLQNGGNNSATILEHYGDVLFQLRNVDQAVANWKKAKANGGNATILDKKIRERKIY